MTDVMDKPYAQMSWSDLKGAAKSRGIRVNSRTRSQIVDALEGNVPRETLPVITNKPETAEEKKSRLLRELAELGITPSQAAVPAKPDQPLGPNYWQMNHTTLKTLCVSRGIIDRSGTREGMIGAMQAEDVKMGLAPHPMEAVTEEEGLRPPRSKVRASENSRDSLVIIDVDGNQIAMVYRVGRVIGGKPVIMDMTRNADIIVKALNEARGVG